jgi:PBP1b-binding outer membrane lipoprotein LpoB
MSKLIYVALITLLLNGCGNPPTKEELAQREAEYIDKVVRTVAVRAKLNNFKIVNTEAEQIITAARRLVEVRTVRGAEYYPDIEEIKIAEELLKKAEEANK